jgi:hypothetical protein
VSFNTCTLALVQTVLISFWSQKQASSLELIHTHSFINMCSPLCNFMTCLQQGISLPTEVPLRIVSDNARISAVVVANNGDQEPARPSRWVAEKDSTKVSSGRSFVEPLAPKLPSRRSSIDPLAPKLPSRRRSIDDLPELHY